VRNKGIAWIAGLVLCVAVAAEGASPPSFRGLGDLTGQGLTSEARGVSGDGSVVIGSSGSAAGQRAFRWEASTGMVALPVPSGLGMTWATDVSLDGRFISGYGGNSFSTPLGWEGLRWDMQAGIDRIAKSGAGVWANGISGDGTLVVGTSGDEAFRWTAAGGLVGMGGLSPSFRSQANGVSAFGPVVVGESLDTGAVPQVRSDFRWTPADGMASLGGFSGTAVSRDGSAVAGILNGPSGFEAFVWTDTGGMDPLGYYAPGCYTRAFGIAGNGHRVVGYVEFPDETTQAFVWDRMMGMRLLRDMLQDDYGIDLTGWTLQRAWAISDDGTTIVGRAIDPQGNTEAYRAVIIPAPEPASLLLLPAGVMLALRRRRKVAAASRRCT
jgi:probable HAF family extracellular repeat protein